MTDSPRERDLPEDVSVDAWREDKARQVLTDAGWFGTWWVDKTIPVLREAGVFDCAATPLPREPMISRAEAIELLERAEKENRESIDGPWDCYLYHGIREAKKIIAALDLAVLASLPALDAQPDITKEFLDGLIDDIPGHKNNDTHYGARVLRDAILSSLATPETEGPEE